MSERTHASFFSGVGGLDLGLERAGWHTVSFSEIDPYASAVLRERWPGVPNLGSITDLVRLADGRVRDVDVSGRNGRDHHQQQDPGGWTTAALWTGGFPCQDLSVAGKRRGLAGERSGLAFAFLDLVGRHRPRAVLLENVPGLLSSHGGKDLGALLGLLGDLGYGWAFRVLDAQWFGVPQRRRRVFILALDLERHPDAFGAAEVLAVGTRCGRDHPQEREAWARAAGRAGEGPIGTLREHVRPGSNTDHTVLVDRPSPDPARMRAPDGLAGRLDGGDGLGFAQNQRGEVRMTGPVSPQVTTGGGKPGEGYPAVLVRPWVTSGPEMIDGSGYHRERLSYAETPTLNGYSTPMVGNTRAGEAGEADEPDGLDSHRYRCVGNGVAAPVAEWIGRRLMDYFEETA